MLILKNGDICPACEKGRLEKGKRDIIFKYKNGSIKFKNETTFKCNLCLYETPDKKSGKKVEKKLSIFRSTIDDQNSARVERCPYCKQKTFHNPCGHCHKLRPEVSILIFGPVGYIDEYSR